MLLVQYRLNARLPSLPRRLVKSAPCFSADFLDTMHASRGLSRYCRRLWRSSLPPYANVPFASPLLGRAPSSRSIATRTVKGAHPTSSAQSAVHPMPTAHSATIANSVERRGGTRPRQVCQQVASAEVLAPVDIRLDAALHRGAGCEPSASLPR
jgi:hypothetical protein